MIHIERPPQPAVFRSPAMVKAYKELRSYFTKAESERSQIRPFMSVPTRELRSHLYRMGHSKCAYCEQLIDEHTLNIETFRPRSVAYGPKEKTTGDHYWWLAYEWSNLLPVCRDCNVAKRNLFPVRGNRCATLAKGNSLLKEDALLIDPTQEEPQHFFEFLEDGSMRPGAWLTVSDRERAQVTIDVLRLNRPDLLVHRRTVNEQMDAVITGHLVTGSPAEEDTWIRGIFKRLEPEHSFFAARSWAFVRGLEALRGRVKNPTGRKYLKMCEARVSVLTELLAKGSLPGPARTFDVAGPVQQKRKTRPKASGTLTLRSVTVQNFRVIENVTFQIPGDVPGDLQRVARIVDPAGHDGAWDAGRMRGWKMLLGENGSGKSTLLQAIAIALMGEEHFKRSGMRSAGHLRHGAKEGLIRLSFHEVSETIEVLVRKRTMKWRKGSPGADVFLRAYGATRLMGRARSGSGSVPRRKVDNLFDPYVPLVHARSWLASLNPKDLRIACTTLKDLLSIEAGQGDLKFDPRSRAGRHARPFGLWKHGRFVSLDHFSAGYQTILALACDIMAGIGKNLSELRDAAGILLIDEIGTNLHPRWRMRILVSLASAFSNMQLIASTHEPLCLHGLGHREVAVVQRRKDDVWLNDELPSPAGLRTDQLLTSEFFGLNTTMDLVTEEKFTVYYDLLSRKGRHTAREVQLCAELEKELSGKSVLGSNRRDRFILRAVDEYLANESLNLDRVRKTKASKRVKEALAQALSRIDVAS